LSSAAHIHAALGGGGPRWRPLNVAVASSEWQDAGGDPGRRLGDGGIQLRPDNGGASSSAGESSGGLAVAAFAPCRILNFVTRISYSVVGMFGLFHIVFVDFVIVGQ
jgi:hypothetical protein